MRKHYLDNIRWITVCLVVIYHVIYIYNGVQPFGVIGAFHEKQYQDAFMYIVYPWFMALLFVVSGMSSRFYLDGHTEKEFKKSRTNKLLIPSTLGLVVFQWILGYYNVLIGGTFANEMANVPLVIKAAICILSGTGPLWYIQMLWIFSMILLLVRKLDKDRIWNAGSKVQPWFLILFTIVIYGAAQVLNTPVVTVYRFGIYGLCFFMGYFVFSHEEVMERLTKFWLPLSIAAIGLAIAYTAIYFGENYAIEPYINNVLACVFCWTAILAILSSMKKWFDYSTKFTSWMSSKSWGLYIFHYLPLAMVAYYLNKFGKSVPAFFSYLLVLLASFVGAFLLNEIISRIPVLNYCVLGIKKERKDVK